MIMKDFKNFARKWAEKTLEKHKDDTKISDMFLEQRILGSLLFSVDENGDKTWIPRLEKDTRYEIRPIEVVDGKIVIK